MGLVVYGYSTKNWVHCTQPRLMSFVDVVSITGATAPAIVFLLKNMTLEFGMNLLSSHTVPKIHAQNIFAICGDSLQSLQLVVSISLR